MLLKENIVIEKNIPISIRNTSKIPETLRAMEIGDSFRTNNQSIHFYCSAHGKKLNKKFQYKSFIENGEKFFRVWRTR